MVIWYHWDGYKTTLAHSFRSEEHPKFKNSMQRSGVGRPFENGPNTKTKKCARFSTGYHPRQHPISHTSHFATLILWPKRCTADYSQTVSGTAKAEELLRIHNIPNTLAQRQEAALMNYGNGGNAWRARIRRVRFNGASFIDGQCFPAW